MISAIKKLFGKHYQMERLCILTSILVVSLCITLFMGGIQTHNNNKLAYETIATYQPKFTTTVTDVDGEVSGIYTNKDKTKVFLVIKYDDTKLVSTNAKDYNVILTNEKDNMQYKPGLSIYGFGSTGYLGFYFTNANGFPSEKLTVLIYSNNKLSTKYDEDGNEQRDRIYLTENFGAFSIEYAPFLDETGPINMSRIYSEVITTKQEEKIKESLNSQLEHMSELLKQIDEFEDRLHTDNIQVPERKDIIAGDTVTYDSNTGLYTLHPVKSFNGGLNLNWQVNSVVNGYLSSLNPKTSGMTDKAFVTAVKNAQNDQSDIVSDTDLVPSVLTDTSGNEIRVGEADTITDTSIQDDINNYKSALDEYYDAKLKYQTSAQLELLILELNNLSIDTRFTVNDDPEAIKVVTK